ncbi:hypothetical protein AMK11_22730 [Streptomyces sp. CB02414]|nr:hypothetical protein AMK11_22730 [Streptomyces sp. CB02414]
MPEALFRQLLDLRLHQLMGSGPLECRPHLLHGVLGLRVRVRSQRYGGLTVVGGATAGRYHFESPLLPYLDALQLMRQRFRSRDHAAVGAVRTASATAPVACQTMTAQIAVISARRLRTVGRGAAGRGSRTPGRAARSTTPPKSMPRRVMLLPICEGISQAPSTARAYRTPATRPVRQ